jgi:hypothetical protein
MHLSSGEAGTPRPLQHTVLGQATWIKLSRLSRLCLSLHLDFLHMIPSTNRLGDTQIITHHWLKSHLHPTFVNHGVLFHSCMLFQWSVAFPINYTLASWESFCLLLEHTVQTWACGLPGSQPGPLTQPLLGKPQSALCWWKSEVQRGITPDQKLQSCSEPVRICDAKKKNSILNYKHTSWMDAERVQVISCPETMVTYF